MSFYFLCFYLHRRLSERGDIDASLEFKTADQSPKVESQPLTPNINLSTVYTSPLVADYWNLPNVDG